MIRHIVLTKFKTDTPEEVIAEIYRELRSLTEELKGANGFTGGRSTSPEQIERGYNHGFVVDFEHWADLNAYAEHPVHKTLGARIIENAVGGLDGVVVLDIEV